MISKPKWSPAHSSQAKPWKCSNATASFENTPYSLEPNCKESPGGLRDLHMLLWVAKASGLGTHLERPENQGHDHARWNSDNFKRNEDVLSLIRWRLHWMAKRREDRLVFDLQTVCRKTWAWRLSSPKTVISNPRRASEALMKEYYWAAKAVSQLNQIIHLNIEDWLFQARPKRIHLKC